MTFLNIHVDVHIHSNCFTFYTFLRYVLSISVHYTTLLALELLQLSAVHLFNCAIFLNSAVYNKRQLSNPPFISILNNYACTWHNRDRFPAVTVTSHLIRTSLLQSCWQINWFHYHSLRLLFFGLFDSTFPLPMANERWRFLSFFSKFWMSLAHWSFFPKLSYIWLHATISVLWFPHIIPVTTQNLKLPQHVRML